MRRIGLLAVAVLLVLAAGLAAALARSEGEQVAPAKVPRPESSVLAIIESEVEGSRLAWLDPRTLRLLPKGSIRLSGGAWAPVFAPSGTMVALGGLGAEGLRIVDIDAMRLVSRAARRVDSRSLQPLAWLADRRLIALDFAHMQGPGVAHVQKLLVVDPVARRLVAERTLGGWATATARTAREVVLLVEPADGIGPARVVVVGPDARLREVTLDRIPAGGRNEGRAGGFGFLIQNPGLAVDRDGRRAFVVAPGAPVAEVDLATLAVSYHELSEPISLRSRVRNWLEPVAKAKSASGWSRQAVWMGNGRIAVSGSDYDGFRSTPSGLKIIQTRSWSVSTLDLRAGFAVVAGELLLSTGVRRNGQTDTQAGMGVAAYTPDADELWHALGDEPIWRIEVAGGYAYVPASGGVRVIDLATGKVWRAGRAEMPTFLVRAAG